MEISNKQKVVDLLKNMETGETTPIGYINPNKYIQHTLTAPNEKLGQLKVFISRGPNDQTLSIHYVRESAAYFIAVNISPSYKEYAEDHGINNAMLSDTVNWFIYN